MLPAWYRHKCKCSFRAPLLHVGAVLSFQAEVYPDKLSIWLVRAGIVCTLDTLQLRLPISASQSLSKTKDLGHTCKQNLTFMQDVSATRSIAQRSGASTLSQAEASNMLMTTVSEAEEAPEPTAAQPAAASAAADQSSAQSHAGALPKAAEATSAESPAGSSPASPQSSFPGFQLAHPRC